MVRLVPIRMSLRPIWIPIVRVYDLLFYKATLFLPRLIDTA